MTVGGCGNDDAPDGDVDGGEIADVARSEQITDGADVNFAISNLRERPEFFPTVADRIWNFSWREQGVPLDQVSAGLRDVIANDTFPFAIVAHGRVRQ